MRQSVAPSPGEASLGGARTESDAREWIDTLWGPLQADGHQLMAELPEEHLRIIAGFLKAARGIQDRHAARVARLLQEPGTCMTPHVWVQQRRVERARDLLSNSSLPLGDIALAVGFSLQSHFTTVFRRLTGLTQAVIRRDQR